MTAITRSLILFALIVIITCGRNSNNPETKPTSPPIPEGWDGESDWLQGEWRPVTVPKN